MQKHPQLLRRPLPPKLLKLSLDKKKIRTAKTGETESPHTEFTQDETTSVVKDKANFLAISRKQAQTVVSTQTLFFDHQVEERVSTISKPKKSTKNVCWCIPQTATSSRFFPSFHSASTQVFGKVTSQKESSRKSKKEKHKIKKIYINKNLEDILILSSEFSKPLHATCPIATTKLKTVHLGYRPLPKTPDHPYQQPLNDLSAMVTRPLLTTESIILESQESARVQQGATVVLSISHFPGITFIPTPILPRKPRRQSMLETLGTENENVENVPKQITPRSPEGLVITRRKESPLSVLRGEGFKTIRATRYETVIAMTNMAIVNCQINGRNALNLKGFFLLKCPDLTPLAFQLIYLDLSFNDLRDFPMEILCLKNLQILKLRNNPIKVIPFEIQQLKFLRIFIIAFNLITDLPHGLFLLTHLEELDISYNDITSIPSEIQKLRSLEKLNIDGNELTSLPSAILKLNLTKISCENNFIHPSFWKENSLNSPQRLTQITSWFIVRNNLHKFYDAIPAKVQKLLKCTSKCEWCHGPKFGKGFRVIRSCDIFGASQLPVMFHVCSSSCYRNVKKSTYISDVIPDKRIPLNLELREG